MVFSSACNRADQARVESLETLRVQLSAMPISLDPATAEDGLSLRILANVMEGLEGYDGSGRLKPFLAQQVAISADQKRYEFTLRPEAKWSDGRKVAPGDFVLGIQRSISPATASRLAEPLMVIRGARDFRLGKTKTLSGVYEKNGKLIFELERPISYFLQLLTLNTAMPARQDVLDAHGGRWPAGEKLSQVPVTGPYRFTHYVHEQKIGMEKNPQYWGARSGGVRTVEWVVVGDEATGMNLFERGMLDILTRIPIVDFQRLSREGKVRTEPFLATYYLGFNLKKPPFDQAQVRRAFSAAIRRKEIVDALITGEVPAGAWIPPGLEGHVPFENSKIEKSVLKPAVIRQSAVTLQFDSGEKNRIVVEKIQQDIQRELGREQGIKLSLVNLDWKSHVKAIQQDPPPVFRFAWQTPFADPAFLLGLFTSPNPNNYSKWSNERYDRLVDRIEKEKPGPVREELIRSAQKILVDDEAVIAPLYHYVLNYGVSSRIVNFHANPFGVIRFDELEIKK
jgi:oligopeptide transport system substrate-binding protein